LESLLWTSGLYIFLTDNFYHTALITGSSMSPTLNPTFSSTGYRDLLLFSRPRPHTPLRRGDIVEFYTPVDATKKSVKRIIALPGDTVGWDSWVGGRVEVPAGHLWVEGDNWRESRDSNWYGPVSRGLVTGKAMKILW
ncbi:hypothetical protein M433DRAFT_31546, partial [Acidomyces richmondensis BFW]